VWTSSPNRRQKGCIPPRVLNVLFIGIHALCYRGNPNQIHWLVQLCLIFSSLFLISSLGSHALTLAKINREGAHARPNLREFILSLRPVRSMTPLCHPSHFSQLEHWKMLSVCEAEESGAAVWLGSTDLRHDAPNSLRAACSLHGLRRVKNRWDSSQKVWPWGAVNIHYLSCLHTVTTTQNKNIASLFHT